jgi:hypothetical protein
MDAFKAFFFRYYREYLSFSASFLQDEAAARKVTLEGVPASLPADILREILAFAGEGCFFLPPDCNSLVL